MRIGYACIALGLPGSELKNCRLKNASDAQLLSLIAHNLKSHEKLIDYNISQGISLFRISADLIPFGSSLAKNLPWENLYNELISSIAFKIKKSGMRVSVHPGQYTVLNSPDELVAQRSALELEYHAGLLDMFGLGPEHKVILHLGGIYGNKEQAMKRFETAIRKVESGEAKVQTVKKMLFTMARKYQQDYLLNSYYFYI